MPAEIGDYNSRISVTTDTGTTTASVGENVGSVTINGITYGLYIKTEGSTIDFEIKENEGSTPLPIIVHGLHVFGQQIEFYKTDANTYVMSAINLVWAPEPSVTIVTSPALPISVTMGPGSSVNLSKSDGSAFTEQDIVGLKVTADGTLCEISWREQAQQWAVSMGSNTISYIEPSVIGQTEFNMRLAGSATYTVESIELS